MGPPRNKAKHRGPRNGRSNTLGLSERDLARILDSYDAMTDCAPGAHRKYVRRPFRLATMPLHLARGDGADSVIMVACRNLSRSGMSVLHRAYQYPGTACQVELPGSDGRAHLVKGKIVRCTHRSGTIHELGISFDKPVDMKNLMGTGLFSDWFSLERVDPAELVGTLLFADSCDADRRLLRHHLRETNISVTTAENGAGGIERAVGGYDLIICDFNLGDMDACTFVGELRDAGVRSPIIVVTSDTAVSRQRLSKVNAQAFLAKPIDKDLLLRAIAEFFQLDESTRMQLSFTSSLAPDHPNAMLVDEYVSDLQQAAVFLQDAVARGDHKACRFKAGEIKGVAPAMGFEVIAQLAGRVMAALAGSPNLEKSANEVKRLINACTRAGVKSAA